MGLRGRHFLFRGGSLGRSLEHALLLFFRNGGGLATHRAREQIFRAVGDEGDEEDGEVGLFAMNRPLRGVVTAGTIHDAGVPEMFCFSICQTEYEKHIFVYGGQVCHDLSCGVKVGRLV